MLKVGGKTYLFGPDEELTNPKDTNAIRLVPSFPAFAFGYGHDPSTRYFISKIESLDLTDKKVADIGCGSGILSILISKQGVKELTSVENFNISLPITEKNFQINNVSPIFIKESYTVLEKESFDIIFCNIYFDFRQTEEVKSIVKYLKIDGIAYISSQSKDIEFENATIEESDFIELDKCYVLKIKRIS